MRAKSGFCLFGLLVFFVYSAYADTLRLKNGRSIEGIIKKEDTESIQLEISAGTVSFLKSEIADIIRSSGGEAEFMRNRWISNKAELDSKLARQRMEEESTPRKASFSHDAKGMSIGVKLNNKVETTMVLDTGASLVLLTRDTAKKLGINLERLKPNMRVQVADGRSIEAARITLDSVIVENSEAKNVEASVLMDGKGDFGFGDGLLGMSFLKNFSFKIDLKEKKLILEKL